MLKAPFIGGEHLIEFHDLVTVVCISRSRVLSDLMVKLIFGELLLVKFCFVGKQ